jgi:hypothetical protein
VAALHHRRQQGIAIVVAVEHGHLRARHHDVAHLDVGHAQHALEHGQRVAFDDAAGFRVAQIVLQLAAVLRLTDQGARQLAQPFAAGAEIRLFLFLVLRAHR